MALTACRECGTQVSTDAETCPHCGIRSPTANNPLGLSKLRFQNWKWWIGGIGVLIFVFWFFGGFVLIMPLLGIDVDAESMLSSDIPKCESLTAKKLAKQSIEGMPLSKVLNISVFEIRDVQEAAYDSANKKRLCGATALLNSGKHSIQYSIEWADQNARTVYVQTILDK
jgi:hypothetical protein